MTEDNMHYNISIPSFVTQDMNINDLDIWTRFAHNMLDVFYIHKSTRCPSLKNWDKIALMTFAWSRGPISFIFRQAAASAGLPIDSFFKQEKAQIYMHGNWWIIIIVIDPVMKILDSSPKIAEIESRLTKYTFLSRNSLPGYLDGIIFQNLKNGKSTIFVYVRVPWPL